MNPLTTTHSNPCLQESFHPSTTELLLGIKTPFPECSLVCFETKTEFPLLPHPFSGAAQTDWGVALQGVGNGICL